MLKAAEAYEAVKKTMIMARRLILVVLPFEVDPLEGVVFDPT